MAELEKTFLEEVHDSQGLLVNKCETGSEMRPAGILVYDDESRSRGCRVLRELFCDR